MSQLHKWIPMGMLSNASGVTLSMHVQLLSEWVLHWLKAVFIIFPKSRNTFQYPLSNRVCKRLSKRISRVEHCVYHRSLASTSREEGLVTAQLHCAVWSVDTCLYVGRSVGDIKAFQNNFAFISYLQKRVSGWNAYQIALFPAFQKGVSNPLGPNQNSFAFIICKNHPESRLETLILHQKSDD